MVDQADKEKRSIRLRVKESLISSAGDIVFGMEDGAVSIFGLVLGVAVGSRQQMQSF